jgi:hypothetical protein
MTSSHTFGVEFEFALCLRERPTTANPNPKWCLNYIDPPTLEEQDDPAKRALAKTLIDGGISAVPDILALRNQHPRQFWFPGSWIVAYDSSIQPPDEIHEWAKIELKSHPLPYNDNSLAQVKYVCDLITSNYVVDTNGTCGLHVHVGNGPYGFKLPMLKTLSSFLYTFDPLLSDIHPKFRHTLKYCSSLRRGQLGELGLSVADVLAGIAGSESIAELKGMINPEDSGHRSAYNFEHMFDQDMAPVSERKHTIEFRQHAATLDSEHVLAWIDLVCGLVCFAEACETNILTGILSESAQRQDQEGEPYWRTSGICLNSLFIMLGLGDAADFYGNVDPVE